MVAQARDRLPAFGARVQPVSAAQLALLARARPSILIQPVSTAQLALLARARSSGLIQPLPGLTSLARTWTGSPARFLVGWILTTQARPNGAKGLP